MSDRDTVRLTYEQAQQLLELIRAGGVLSNIAFNLSQMDGLLHKRDRDVLRRARVKWDEAMHGSEEVRHLLVLLPPDFDPIELGC